MAKLLRRQAVEKIIGHGRTYINDRIDSKSPKYNPDFPRPIKIDSMTNVWIESEVYAWVDSVIASAREHAA